MATIDLVRDPKNSYIFYDVDKAVGPGAPNTRGDAMLVQYFLREIFKGVPEFQKTPFPGGTMAVDGVAGPQTFAAIKHFQKIAAQRYGGGSQDGRVDTPAGEKHYGAFSGAQYTILNMNNAFAKARRQDWPRVSRTFDCPSELRSQIIEPKFIST